MESEGRPLPAIPFETITAEELLASAPPPVDLVTPHPRDLASIIYTSGTTGPSKGVLVPWGDIAAFVLRIWPIGDLGEDDVIYTYTPSSHIGAKPPVPRGLAQRKPRAPPRVQDRLLPRRHPKVRRDHHSRRRCNRPLPRTAASATRRCRHHAQEPRDGAVVPDLEGFKRRFGLRIGTCYSMTELSGPIASEGWNVVNWKSSGKLSPGWPWYELRVVDEHDYDVGPGKVGELIVRSGEPWALNVGYYGMPEQTAEAWRNGWFHTGDALPVRRGRLLLLRRPAEGHHPPAGREHLVVRGRGGRERAHPACVSRQQSQSHPRYTEDDVMICVVLKPEATLDPASSATSSRTRHAPLHGAALRRDHGRHAEDGRHDAHAEGQAPRARGHRGDVGSRSRVAAVMRGGCTGTVCARAGRSPGPRCPNR